MDHYTEYKELLKQFHQLKDTFDLLNEKHFNNSTLSYGEVKNLVKEVLLSINSYEQVVKINIYKASLYLEDARCFVDDLIACFEESGIKLLPYNKSKYDDYSVCIDNYRVFRSRSIGWWLILWHPRCLWGAFYFLNFFSFKN